MFIHFLAIDRLSAHGSVNWNAEITDVILKSCVRDSQRSIDEWAYHLAIGVVTEFTHEMLIYDDTRYKSWHFRRFDLNRNAIYLHTKHQRLRVKWNEMKWDVGN